MIDYAVHSLGNWHLNLISVRQLKRGRDGVDTFDHHADFLDCLLRCTSLSDEVSAAVIPAVQARRGDYQIANTGKSGKCLLAAAHLKTQPLYLTPNGNDVEVQH